MANFTFNVSKGAVRYYASLPAANDALVVVPIEATGIQADVTLKDYNDLAALLAASNNEQATMGRKTISTVTVTQDNTNDRVDVDFADPVWTSATGNAVAALIVCYDPDTTAGTDADLKPLTKHDWSVTPNGMDIGAILHAAGFYRAQDGA